MSKKVILVIMDGWGIAKNSAVSAIHHAHTPFYDNALSSQANTTLQASEEPVGLPAGQMGNSEVGHMNIGAGRIVYQDIIRISREIENRSICDNAEFLALTEYCKENDKPLHLFGLLSDGGVHSHIDHLKGLLSIISEDKAFSQSVYLHLFTDGRDTRPQGGIEYVRDLEKHMSSVGKGKIATVIGRYYSMDRNKNWDRIKLAYDLLLHGKGVPYDNAETALQANYDADITDEFIKPCCIDMQGGVKPGDAILYFNFRTDRGRQLTDALTQRAFPEQGMEPVGLYYSTMTRYDETFKGIHVLFDKEDIRMGLGETLAIQGKKQIRIAESEKYPHVTFFFNGGREQPFEGESRILCPSPKVATYDLQPEMSAFEIRDKITAELEKEEVDFVCLNFANPDMVGHTGVLEAAIKACETVDACTSAVVETAVKHGYAALITADHGNADRMSNPDGSPHTAHTTSLVPLILFDPEKRGYQLKPGKLGDLAPTILKLMGLEIPASMSGEVLLEK